MPPLLFVTFSMTPYYQHHVFFCINQRDDGRACCADKDSQAMRDYAKMRIKALKLSAPGLCRINIAIYPEGVWYTYVDKEDVDEIIDEHLVHGRIVERLKI